MDPIICFMMLLLYLDHLQSLFLLYRLLVRKRDTGQEMLFDTARKLLSTVLILCKERSRLIAIATDFPWIVCLANYFLSWPTLNCVRFYISACPLRPFSLRSYTAKLSNKLNLNFSQHQIPFLICRAPSLFGTFLYLFRPWSGHHHHRTVITVSVVVHGHTFRACLTRSLSSLQTFHHQRQVHK